MTKKSQIEIIYVIFFYQLLGIIEFLVLFYDLECRMLELYHLLVYFVSATRCHCFDIYFFSEKIVILT